MAKKKYYVVWVGNKAGIFETWDDCKKQVMGVKGARYKSFPSKQEAEIAFEAGYVPKNKNAFKKENSNRNQLSFLEEPNYIPKSISVDAACSGNPGVMEYRGVYTKNGKEIFHYGPVPKGTNNIGEFLAIVHALALMKQKNSNVPIYSDSRTGIGWVRNRKANTKLPRNESTKHLWEVIERAEKWLNTNTYSNEVLKWETHLWGESKADFGRK